MKQNKQQFRQILSRPRQRPESNGTLYNPYLDNNMKSNLRQRGFQSTQHSRKASISPGSHNTIVFTNKKYNNTQKASTQYSDQKSNVSASPQHVITQKNFKLTNGFNISNDDKQNSYLQEKLHNLPPEQYIVIPTHQPHQAMIINTEQSTRSNTKNNQLINYNISTKNKRSESVKRKNPSSTQAHYVNTSTPINNINEKRSQISKTPIRFQTQYKNKNQQNDVYKNQQTEPSMPVSDNIYNLQKTEFMYPQKNSTKPNQRNRGQSYQHDTRISYNNYSKASPQRKSSGSRASKTSNYSNTPTTFNNNIRTTPQNQNYVKMNHKTHTPQSKQYAKTSKNNQQQQHIFNNYGPQSNKQKQQQQQRTIDARRNTEQIQQAYPDIQIGFQNIELFNKIKNQKQQSSNTKGSSTNKKSNNNNHNHNTQTLSNTQASYNTNNYLNTTICNNNTNHIAYKQQNKTASKNPLTLSQLNSSQNEILANLSMISQGSNPEQLYQQMINQKTNNSNSNQKSSILSDQQLQQQYLNQDIRHNTQTSSNKQTQQQYNVNNNNNGNGLNFKRARGITYDKENHHQQNVVINKDIFVNNNQNAKKQQQQQYNKNVQDDTTAESSKKSQKEYDNSNQQKQRDDIQHKQQLQQQQLQQQQQYNLHIRNQSMDTHNQRTQSRQNKTQQITMNQFNMSIKIGSGSYAVVKLGIDKVTGQKVAIKIYDKKIFEDPYKLKNVQREVQILQKLKHPNIIKLFHVIETDKDINLVMEYVGLTSLFQFLKQNSQKRLAEHVVRKIFRQLASGLDYMHKKNISHRDIKLENLLMSDVTNDIKIIDFGFSIITPPGRKLTSFCGTPSYMAPEMIKRQEYEGPPVDIWCLGILLYVLMCGQFPFKGKDEKELYNKILEGEIDVPIHVPNGAKNLLSNILQQDPTKRPTAQDIIDDSWIRGDFESEHFFSEDEN